MADNYIDQDETLGYGEFAAKQITTSVVGLDPPFDDALREVAARVTKATKAMAATLKAAGALPVTTFVGGAAAGHDPASEAGALLGRLVKYAASRDNGEELVKEILGGEGLTTIKRRRRAKLVHALDVAARALAKHKGALPEYEQWRAELARTRGELDELDEKVRASRQKRRAMTPAVAAARDRWLKVYAGAKLVVEGVLRLNDAVDRMPDVFDDLAETHRVSGVTDDAPPAADPKKPA